MGVESGRSVAMMLALEAGSSEGKRRARPDDEIMEAEDMDMTLTSMMTKLGAQDQDNIVALICEVTGVDAPTAAFYLEASNNDPHAAVHLHVQSMAGAPSVPNPPKRTKIVPPPESSVHGALVSLGGLPYGWSARVSSAGTIVFQHNNTGREQAEVPPGFDPTDAPEAGMSTDAPAESQGMESEGPAGSDDVPASPPQVAEAVEPASGEEDVHHSVVCDGCDRQVSGIRYNCLTRPNVDLCESCMWGTDTQQLRLGQKWMKMSFVTA